MRYVPLVAARRRVRLPDALKDNCRHFSSVAGHGRQAPHELVASTSGVKFGRKRHVVGPRARRSFRKHLIKHGREPFRFPCSLKRKTNNVASASVVVVMYCVSVGGRVRIEIHKT